MNVDLFDHEKHSIPILSSNNSQVFIPLQSFKGCVGYCFYPWHPDGRVVEKVCPGSISEP